MKSELVHSLTSTFVGHAQVTDNGVEYWLARDLQVLLGYTQWRNFLSVISKAETACEGSGHAIADHFADVSKMVEIGSGGTGVNSVHATQFLRWATRVSREFAAPKVQSIVAQGNALGSIRRLFQSPERAA